MTEVHIEPAALSEATVMFHKDYGTYVRMAYDPSRIDEPKALDLLALYVPRLTGNRWRVIHHATA